MTLSLPASTAAASSDGVDPFHAAALSRVALWDLIGQWTDALRDVADAEDGEDRPRRGDEVRGVARSLDVLACDLVVQLGQAAAQLTAARRTL